MKKMMPKIRIAGLDYEINQVKGLADCGSSDFINQVILIDDNLTLDGKMSCLLHEIIEIINHSYDLNLPHSTIATLEASLFGIIKEYF